MAYSLETLSGFKGFLSAQGFDNKSTNEIISYLEGLGFTTQVAVDFETGSNPPGFDPNAQVDVATDGTVTFAPSGSANLLLDVADSHITVTGSLNEAVSASAGDNTIDLENTGHDTVFLSTGNNTVTSGFAAGPDTIDANNGNETYIDKSSSSNTFLGAGFTGNDSIVIHNNGTGLDSITLGNGQNTVSAGSSTDNLSIHQDGTGSASITLGHGQDSVYLATDHGAGVSGVTDSVTAGSGSDTIDFVGASLSQAHLYYESNGVIVTFGGQLVPNSGGTGYIPDPSNPPVQTVSITAAPGSDVTLEFTDGHLKA